MTGAIVNAGMIIAGGCAGLLHQICAAGFVLVGCIGLNFICETRRLVKVANFLPALASLG